MQENLPGLTRELRKEKCPQRVVAGALRRIAAETPPPSRFRGAIPAAFAILALLCAAFVWREWTAHDAGRPRQLSGQRAEGRAHVAHEAETALDIFGNVMLDAGARSERVISERGVPPLQRGFDTARTTIINQTKL